VASSEAIVFAVARTHLLFAVDLEPSIARVLNDISRQRAKLHEKLLQSA
jgi:hypothetical protein